MTVEAYKGPVTKSFRPSPTIPVTYKSAGIAYFYSNERNKQSSLGGWLTNAKLGGKLTFAVNLNDGSIARPPNIKLQMRLKIQFGTKDAKTGVITWKDYSEKNTSRWHLADDDKNLKTPEPCARFSDPCPVVKNCEIRMNGADKITMNNQEESFCNWFTYLMKSTDAEKRNMENCENWGYDYDQRQHQFGNFQTSEFKHMTGLVVVDKTTKTWMETFFGKVPNVDLKYTPLFNKEDKLAESSGVKDFDMLLPCCLTQRAESLPGFQNFECTIKLHDDPMLLVARMANKSGLGTVLTNEQVRVVYDLENTYIYIRHEEPMSEEEMKVFAPESNVYYTRDKCQLIQSESFGARIPGGKQKLYNFTQPTKGFPGRAYFGVIKASELEGEGSFGHDTFSCEPHNVTGIALYMGTKPVFREYPMIPWCQSIAKKMQYRMLLDADAPPNHKVTREARGSGHPNRQALGTYYGFFEIPPTETGDNSFCPKYNTSIIIEVKTENSKKGSDTTVTADPENYKVHSGPYKIILAYFEPNSLSLVSNTTNRWTEEQNLYQTLGDVPDSQNRFTGDLEKKY